MTDAVASVLGAEGYTIILALLRFHADLGDKRLPDSCKEGSEVMAALEIEAAVPCIA